MKKKMLFNGFDNKTLGILGGGQLGRMIGQSASRLGIKVIIMDPNKKSPAFQVANRSIVASFENKEKLRKFAKSCDVVTYEFENIPLNSLQYIAKFTKIYPGINPLKISQDRLLEKKFIKNLNIKVANFYPINNKQDLITNLSYLKGRGLLKTRKLGYDGKGQTYIQLNKQKNLQIPRIKKNDYIIEELINFNKEISVIVVREANGKSTCYEPSENIHREGILRETYFPARISVKSKEEAKKIAKKIAKKLDIIGLLAVEMFVCNNDKILVNEIAPRPHNSGHWTMDTCNISQFEALLRALFNAPMANLEYFSKCKMVNLLGDNYFTYKKFLNKKNYKLHLYGKEKLESKRKMGHINIIF